MNLKSFLIFQFQNTYSPIIKSNFDLWIENLSKSWNTEITAVIWRKKQTGNHDQQQSPPSPETEGHGRRRPFSGRKRK